MVHLIVLFVGQIKALAPVYLHEMWTYYRFMAILNGTYQIILTQRVVLYKHTIEEAFESGWQFC